MPDTTPDRIAATLDEIRERRYRKGTAPGLMAGWLADHAADDIPRLLAAVEAALGFHEEFDGTCSGCTDAYGDPAAWPCAEYRAIAAELAKGAGDA